MNDKSYLILCVDDEREVLDAVLHDLAFLRSYFELEGAESAEEARQVIEEWEGEGGKLALILCDHIMPGMAGVDFLIELKGRESTRASRKLLLTGQAGLEATIAAVNRGGLDYYVAKPWQRDALSAVVRDQLTDYLLEQGPQGAVVYAAVVNQERLFQALHQQPCDD